MDVLPLSSRLQKYLQKHGLEKTFNKQLRFFQTDPFYPGLHTEILEPRHLRLYSFRSPVVTA